MIKPKTSQDLFNKIRSKFSNIQLGDSEGNVTADPKSAVFFDFEFTIYGIHFPLTYGIIEILNRSLYYLPDF